MLSWQYSNYLKHPNWKDHSWIWTTWQIFFSPREITIWASSFAPLINYSFPLAFKSRCIYPSHHLEHINYHLTTWELTLLTLWIEFGLSEPPFLCLNFFFSYVTPDDCVKSIFVYIPDLSWNSYIHPLYISFLVASDSSTVITSGFTQKGLNTKDF